MALNNSQFHGVLATLNPIGRCFSLSLSYCFRLCYSCLLPNSYLLDINCHLTIQLDGTWHMQQKFLCSELMCLSL